MWGCLWMRTDDEVGNVGLATMYPKWQISRFAAFGKALDARLLRWKYAQHCSAFRRLLVQNGKLFVVERRDDLVFELHVCWCITGT